jgi:hypothetical protein
VVRAFESVFPNGGAGDAHCVIDRCGEVFWLLRVGGGVSSVLVGGTDNDSACVPPPAMKTVWTAPQYAALLVVSRTGRDGVSITIAAPHVPIEFKAGTGVSVRDGSLAIGR